ncbi:hypothetical protein PIROE2DRAFT_16311 [Piromyces sp. E2]|nr:hypothetical protein PIROE2DRAFT_16311 [Piromyces sp. E2]|eukprot:OUM58422.1 hypothetical protein PIROE2DRAFT_16311 [Piromyces sp. E2]
MGDFLESIWEELLIGLLTFIIGYYWGQWRGVKAWNRKEFKDKINISLNTINQIDKHRYKLQIRTLLEQDLNSIIKNEKVKSIIKKAINKTRPGKPLLIFDEGDAWFILNAILNQIAFQFSNGALKKDLGMEVASEWYTFCLTYEKEENLLTQKIRVILIKRDRLENFPEDDSHFILESFTHDIRVQTLRILKQELREHPYCFMDIELSQ